MDPSQFSPLQIVVLSSILSWGAICFFLRTIRSSWAGLLTAGTIITLNLCMLTPHFPRATVTIALLFNGSLLTILITGLLIHAWKSGGQ
ncbi:MAG TPA: hypothetical protein VFE58_00085 [Tepidisphaeraceae bacterium]|jgi:hypothetical protein|nr:hypothetical protein [Tepidisphaeraceae bacterium]